MKETLIKTRGILTGGKTARWIPKGILVIRDGRIVDLAKRSSKKTIDLSEKIALPGFIQTHVHLCQTDARGLADDLPLLGWLKDRIMPYEASLTPAKLRRSARHGLGELLRSGTTCIMDMGTIHHTEVIAQEMLASGIRGYFGKCLMDRNDLFPPLQEETDQALVEAQKLAQKWHGKEDKLRWAWSPRFALTCSESLLRQSYELLREYPGTLFHTHASENLAELDAIQAKHRMRNVEYLEDLGLLSEKSCLAHCVHLSDREVQLLASRKAAVLHCPSSNLKLGSGIADIMKYRKHGISVSIGADGAACNNHLDMWGEMRLASLLQKLNHGPTAMSAKETFLAATWEGAKALGWEREIGSLDVEKSADVIFVDPPDELSRKSHPGEEQLYGSLVYAGRPEMVTDVMIGGEWAMRRNVLKYSSLW